MAKREETHPAQARMRIKANFLSVQLVSWSTSGRTLCCSAAGWVHVQWRKPSFCLQPQTGSMCGCCATETRYGLHQAAGKALPKRPAWSALPRWLGCEDWPPDLAVLCEDWLRDFQNNFLRTVVVLCLWNSLLWWWCVNSWEIGTLFILDLLDSHFVWQAHDHKDCSVSAPLCIHKLWFWPHYLFVHHPLVNSPSQWSSCVLCTVS